MRIFAHITNEILLQFSVLSRRMDTARRASVRLVRVWMKRWPLWAMLTYVKLGACATEDIAAALELPGPPCDRCGHDHLSRECPDCPEPRPPNCCEWFAAVSTDQLLSDAARDVQSVRSTGSEQFRIFACSDSYSLGEGSHWFTVAYRIRRRAVCMSIERFPLILVLASLLGAFLCLLLLTPLTLQQPS